ncbi:conserved hypothetical protein [Theileria orientalis strain Shintoku]|uniref:GPI-anchored wall transfer protein 1 n=1 Tax=Theileria orientalis strain Shintoku TaxID=869250 RepID=J4CDN1_THEOR|nr:conserved hypothetical protein [Theileria orientalis strain Shintoku]BAM41432.1 conserved hypothetical protein [Theileria orientalis strain Shintoku]|eukprot:XP_009691733.1 conserved hypothetical protein [Theileria orientalis strain Shintoku]
MFYPHFEARLPQIYYKSLIFIFEEAIEEDMVNYNKRFREIYEIPEDEEVFIYNYRSYMEYYEQELKDKDLSYAAIRKINKYGCIYKTKFPVYRGLGIFVGDRVMEHHYLYHTLIIIFVTNVSGYLLRRHGYQLIGLATTMFTHFSCLLSSFQLFKNRALQFTFTSLVILVPHLMVMYLSDAIYLALAIVLLFGLIIVRYISKKPWKNKEESPLENGFVYYVNFAKGALIVAIVIGTIRLFVNGFVSDSGKTYYDGFSAVSDRQKYIHVNKYRHTLTMDIGAGFFVTQTGSSIALSRRKKNVWIILKKNIIVMAIAIIRTISIALLGYGVDEREYGKHWNFFYTLAITRIGMPFICIIDNDAVAVDLINTYCHKYIVRALPFAIVLVYELILILTGAVKKLPDLPRSNVIYANREGLLSIPNSVSGALFVLLITNIAVSYYKKGEKFRACSMSFFFLANILYFAKLKSCRSLNNMRYLFYVMFLYNFALGSMVMFEILYPRYKENQVIDSVGKYPLMIYLIANVLTGFTNMIFKPYLYPLPYFVLILVSTQGHTNRGYTDTKFTHEPRLHGY